VIWTRARLKALRWQMKADLLLLDEKEARHIAQRLGLNIMGVIGVLFLAYNRKEIDRIKPCLDALRQTAGFYLSESLYSAILEKANENK
jgi:predicted nucleic acid-binding protein